MKEGERGGGAANIKLEAENARRTRSGEIVATVHVSEDGSSLYADVVKLARGRARARFIAALKDRIERSDTTQIEPTLLRLCQQIKLKPE